jgi:hypothetical protein
MREGAVAHRFFVVGWGYINISIRMKRDHRFGHFKGFFKTKLEASRDNNTTPTLMYINMMLPRQLASDSLSILKVNASLL